MNISDRITERNQKGEDANKQALREVRHWRMPVATGVLIAVAIAFTGSSNLPTVAAQRADTPPKSMIKVGAYYFKIDSIQHAQAISPDPGVNLPSRLRMVVDGKDITVSGADADTLRKWLDSQSIEVPAASGAKN